MNFMSYFPKVSLPSCTARLEMYNRPVSIYRKIGKRTFQACMTWRDSADIAQERNSSLAHAVLFVERLGYGSIELNVRLSGTLGKLNSSQPSWYKFWQVIEPTNALRPTNRRLQSQNNWTVAPMPPPSSLNSVANFQHDSSTPPYLEPATYPPVWPNCYATSPWCISAIFMPFS